MYFFFSKALSPFFLVFNIFILILFFFLIFKKLRKKIAYLIYLFVFLAIFPVGKFLEYNILSKNYYGENDNNFDSILILGGSERRITQALSFWTLNKKAIIIFTGGSNILNDSSMNQKEISIFKKLAEAVLEPHQYIISKPTKNTFENLKAFKEINNVHQFKKTTVVSDTWHYNRVLKTAEIYNIKLTPYKWPKNDKKSLIELYQNLNFLSNYESLNIFFKEILGLIPILFKV
jgi:uncharacterized SAM-binding protein YcdF (DUF218 family)